MENEINLSELVHALKNRWKLIVISVLTCTLLASIMTFFIIKPQYESSVKVFIGKEEGENVTYDQGDLSMYQKLLKTYAEVLKTKDLAKDVISKNKLDIKPSDIINNITVSPLADTQIIQIKYQYDSAYEAAMILDGIKNEFITVAQELVPNANIRVIEDVRQNDVPVSPNKVMNIAIAIILGGMIGIGLVFLLEFLDNTYKNKDILENDLGISVIGVIPNISEGAKDGRTSNKH